MKHIILILLAIMLKFTNVHSQALNEYYDFQHSINLNQKISNGGVNPFIENGTIYLLDSEFSFTDFSEGDNAVLNLMIIDTNYNVKNKQFILYTKRLYNSYLTTIKTFATKNGKIYIHDTKNLFVFDIETQNLLRKFPLDGYFSKSLIKKNKLFLFSAYPDDILDYNPPSKIKVVIYDILEDSYTSKYLDEVRGKALLKVNPKKIFSVSNELIAFADILNSRILL